MDNNHPQRNFSDADLLAAIPKLKPLALKLTRNRELAEDLVHDTVARALSYEKTFEASTHLNAWLIQILKNRFLEGRRRERRLESGGDLDKIAAERGLFTFVDPVDGMTARQILDAIPNILSLRERQFLNYAADRLPYEDIAALLGCKVGTAKSNVSRARTRLKEAFGSSQGEILETCKASPPDNIRHRGPTTPLIEFTLFADGRNEKVFNGLVSNGLPDFYRLYDKVEPMYRQTHAPRNLKDRLREVLNRPEFLIHKGMLAPLAKIIVDASQQPPKAEATAVANVSLPAAGVTFAAAFNDTALVAPAGPVGRRTDPNGSPHQRFSQA